MCVHPVNRCLAGNIQSCDNTAIGGSTPRHGPNFFAKICNVIKQNALLSSNWPGVVLNRVVVAGWAAIVYQELLARHQVPVIILNIKIVHRHSLTIQRHRSYNDRAIRSRQSFAGE